MLYVENLDNVFNTIYRRDFPSQGALEKEMKPYIVAWARRKFENRKVLFRISIFGHEIALSIMESL